MKKVLQVVNSINNVGDLLASFITEKVAGVQVLPVFKTIPPEFKGHRILSGLGSCLSYYGDWPLNVWGTGFEPGYADRVARDYSGARERWRIHAVRGHVTRAILGLGEDVVIGDPAILLPGFYQPRDAPFCALRYFLHCENDAVILDDSEIEVVSTRVNPFRAIDLVANTGFVFTEALHIAILAYAYGIPWAWVLNKHHRGMVKWFDWFSSLEVEPGCHGPRDLKAARAWHDAKHSNFKRLEGGRLIDAFPKEVIFEYAETA